MSLSTLRATAQAGPGRGVPRRSSTVIVLAAMLVAVLGAACSGTPKDPAAALAAAVTETFAASYHYEVTIEADPEALRALGAQGAQSAAFLTGLAVEGDVIGDATSLVVRILGIDALEIRRLDADSLYVRAAAQQLLAVAGQGGLAETASVTAALDQLGVSDAMRAGVLAALDGGWVGVEGALDTSALQEALGVTTEDSGDQVTADLAAALGGDLGGAIDRYVTIVGEPSVVDSTTSYEIALGLRELLRNVLTVQAEAQGDDTASIDADLEGVADSVPGVIDVVDGRITGIRVDLARAVEDSTSSGAVELIIALSEHGAVPALTVPDGAVSVPANEFLDAFARLSEFAGSPAS